MSATTATLQAPGLLGSIVILARRELRNVLRVPSGYLPPLLIPLFFYAVQTAQLDGLAQRAGIENYAAFVLPVSILFATANDGAGLSLVFDIERGYFDKIRLTPVSRVALLFGAMSANLVRVFVQGSMVTAVALAFGLRFETGIIGALGMVGLGVLWGMTYAGFGLAIALKTGSPQATQSAGFFMFPLMFLTTSFGPAETLPDGWFRTAIQYNPVTYLLEGMRGFSQTGDLGDVGKALLAIVPLASLTFLFAFVSLRGRQR